MLFLAHDPPIAPVVKPLCWWEHRGFLFRVAVACCDIEVATSQRLRTRLPGSGQPRRAAEPGPGRLPCWQPDERCSTVWGWGRERRVGVALHVACADAEAAPAASSSPRGRGVRVVGERGSTGGVLVGQCEGAGSAPQPTPPPVVLQCGPVIGPALRLLSGAGRGRSTPPKLGIVKAECAIPPRPRMAAPHPGAQRRPGPGCSHPDTSMRECKTRWFGCQGSTYEFSPVARDPGCGPGPWFVGWVCGGPRKRGALQVWVWPGPTPAPGPVWGSR